MLKYALLTYLSLNNVSLSPVIAEICDYRKSRNPKWFTKNFQGIFKNIFLYTKYNCGNIAPLPGDHVSLFFKAIVKKESDNQNVRIKGIQRDDVKVQIVNWSQFRAITCMAFHIYCIDMIQVKLAQI